MKTTLLLLAIAFIFAAKATTLPPHTKETLKTLCKYTNYPDVCINSTRPYAASYPHLDAMAMLDIIIRATNDSAKKTSAQVEKLTSDPRTDPRLKRQFKYCPDAFGRIFLDVKGAKEAFAKHDAGRVASHVQNFAPDFNECRGQFDKGNPLYDEFDYGQFDKGNPLYDEFDYFDPMSLVAMDLYVKAFYPSPPAGPPLTH